SADDPKSSAYSISATGARALLGCEEPGRGKSKLGSQGIGLDPPVFHLCVAPPRSGALPVALSPPRMLDQAQLRLIGWRISSWRDLHNAAIRVFRPPSEFGRDHDASRSL